MLYSVSLNITVYILMTIKDIGLLTVSNRHNYVIVAMSQIFCYHCVEYIKLDTCAKFHDHQSNNNKVMIWGSHAPPPPPPPITDGSKKPMSNRV